MPGVLAEQQLLAHCYAAEALCNLQSPQQAAEQLQAAVALQGASGIQSVQEAAKAGGDAADAHVSPTAPAVQWVLLYVSHVCFSST